MAIIIIIECLVMSKLLVLKWYNKRIYITAVVTNVVSGAVGIGLSLLHNGGWWLVVWFPWVSNYEANLSIPHVRRDFIIVYLIAFILTLLIEGLINTLILKKDFDRKTVLKTTLLTNILTYIIGSVIIYSISYNLISVNFSSL